MKKALAALLVLVLVLGLAACGGAQQAAPAASPAPAEEAAPAAEGAPEETAEPVVVRIGLTGAVYEPIWDVVKEKLKDEGI